MSIQIYPKSGKLLNDDSSLGWIDIREFEFKINDYKFNNQEYILDALLQSSDLWNIDLFWGDNTEVFEFGPFNKNVSTKDFAELTIDQLEDKIQEYTEHPNWGDDLVIFKKLIRKTLNRITDNKQNYNSIFYINSEFCSSKIKVNEDLNFFSYFISIVLISLNHNSIKVICHGGD